VLTLPKECEENGVTRVVCMRPINASSSTFKKDRDLTSEALRLKANLSGPLVLEKIEVLPTTMHV
jgi:hypothetical protein